MGNQNEFKSNESGPTRERGLKDRLSDATSNETLSELEETEEKSGSDASSNDSSPSPDGGLDQPEEIKDAGPM